MLTILAAGSVFFPGLFLLSKQCLKSIPALRWSEGDAVIVSARLVSSIQAVMASSAGYIIASSCDDVIEDQHWLTSTYIMFAVPYFVYDIYAMFMCYWYKLRVKGHEEASAAPRHMASALTSYLRREFLMVLHHVVMVTVCFPVSVFVRQGKGDYFQGIMFMAELSTPSVCLGKILIQGCPATLHGRPKTAAGCGHHHGRRRGSTPAGQRLQSAVRRVGLGHPLRGIGRAGRREENVPMSRGGEGAGEQVATLRRVKSHRRCPQTAPESLTRVPSHSDDVIGHCDRKD
ncbi:ceramide synthase-like isoform X2 [Corythoichthys intestinalis]|uniref:ceramide synthase-like isoform X2 n=1 Tax=Corythoichthys intestinalis TaxID=161448 RepID=UPI0025A59822|nr:ceramide synthase-like isoform X2 [Corythoichthys intestinalis]